MKKYYIKIINNMLCVTRHVEKTYCFVRCNKILARFPSVCSLDNIGGTELHGGLTIARDQLDACRAKGPHMSDSRLFK